MNTVNRKTHFHFKKFSVSHAQSTMKVGTDTVLLGAWTKVDHATNILEIGTGNGTIALMLAQRTSDNVCIDAVEIEPTDAAQAQENFLQSPWPAKIRTHPISIQQFENGIKYDIIVSNPPYFINSQRPPDEKRGQARHTISLSQDRKIFFVLGSLVLKHGKINLSNAG
jgi:tRNA1Val (adenine37-N6)-methyltransferase